MCQVLSSGHCTASSGKCPACGAWACNKSLTVYPQGSAAKPGSKDLVPLSLEKMNMTMQVCVWSAVHRLKQTPVTVIACIETPT